MLLFVITHVLNIQNYYILATKLPLELKKIEKRAICLAIIRK